MLLICLKKLVQVRVRGWTALELQKQRASNTPNYCMGDADYILIRQSFVLPVPRQSSIDSDIHLERYH